MSLLSNPGKSAMSLQDLAARHRPGDCRGHGPTGRQVCDFVCASRGPLQEVARAYQTRSMAMGTQIAVPANNLVTKNELQAMVDA